LRFAERLALSQPAFGLLGSGCLVESRQAFGTRQEVGLQLAGNAITPPGSDLEDGLARAALGVAVDGVGGHRRWHGNHSNIDSIIPAGTRIARFRAPYVYEAFFGIRVHPELRSANSQKLRRQTRARVASQVGVSALGKRRREIVVQFIP